MHMKVSELQQMLETVRADPASPPGAPERLRALHGLVGLCPAFVPGLLALSRSMLLVKDEVPDPPAYFAEIERLLRDAGDASDHEPSALIELAHFTDVVRDEPANAEALFAEAARRALLLLEEAWAGQIGVLGQQDKLDAALKIAEESRRILPDSKRIEEAVEFARQCATG